MLLGVGPTEEEAAEESEEGLCCICHAEQALRGATKTEQPVAPGQPGAAWCDVLVVVRGGWLEVVVLLRLPQSRLRST